jgi:hypothetical protein
MNRPYQLPVWPTDPLPLGASAYALHSASWWRAVTKATLEARR